MLLDDPEHYQEEEQEHGHGAGAEAVVPQPLPVDDELMEVPPEGQDVFDMLGDEPGLLGAQRHTPPGSRTTSGTTATASKRDPLAGAQVAEGEQVVVEEEEEGGERRGKGAATAKSGAAAGLRKGCKRKGAKLLVDDLESIQVWP